MATEVVTQEENVLHNIKIISLCNGVVNKLPNYVENGLFKIAKNEGFHKYSIELDKGCNDGDGIVGNIIKATITGDRITSNGNIEQCRLSLIVKVPPEDKIRRQDYAMKLFAREVYAYNEILPAFRKFQLDQGIVNAFALYPKCYWAHYDAALDQSCIIMEDKRSSGFSMELKSNPIKFEHAKMVMEALGELHAISMAMKQKQPKVFEQFQQLGNVTASENPGHKQMVKSMIINGTRRAVSTLTSGATDTELKRRISCIAVDMANENRLVSLGEPHCVLIHGDCWINNLMFNYEVSYSMYIYELSMCLTVTNSLSIYIIYI